MEHKESKLQIQCVAWFAYEYPFLRMLLYHPKNEGGHGRVRGAISKAEGVVAGVADLILQLSDSLGHTCLAIEMKSACGRQSKEQKSFERYLSAAGGKYMIVRSFDEFKKAVMLYVNNVAEDIMRRLRELYREQQIEETNIAREKLRRITLTDVIDDNSTL